MALLFPGVAARSGGYSRLRGAVSRLFPRRHPVEAILDRALRAAARRNQAQQHRHRTHHPGGAESRTLLATPLATGERHVDGSSIWHLVLVVAVFRLLRFILDR